MQAILQATILMLAVSSGLLGVLVPSSFVPAAIQTGILEVRVHEHVNSIKKPVSGALVVLRDSKNALAAQQQRTGSDGVARFLVVPVGSDYAVHIKAAGFVPTSRLGVSMTSEVTTSVEIEIQRVPAPPPGNAPIAVELDETESSKELSAEFIGDMPVYGRDYQHVLTLAPGVNDPGGAGKPEGHRSRERDCKVTVDGVSNVDPVTGLRLSELNAAASEEVPLIGTEAYAHRVDNPFRAPERDPLSTFAIDVDTASYSNVRRFLTSGSLPPADAVRIEELLNYFQYDDPAPMAGEPFAVSTELGACPWREGHALFRIGLKATPIEYVRQGAGNYVFLVDVSGSMEEPNKLPLVKSALKMLARQLRGADRVAIVVYAGAAGLVLDSTNDQSAMVEAIDRLQAGGSTAGGEGIMLAYETAAKNFVQGGVNRVILATDGDFNVGISSEGELVRLIEQRAKTGVYSSVLGFGTGNLQDSKMEQLADHGNGQYHYIDSVNEARRVMVEQVGGTLVTVAKDVKVQVEFNPAAVVQYRLIGYENRMLAAEDFLDDTKDAGEIGAGHSVTALYEIVPVGSQTTTRPVEPLKYSSQGAAPSADASELATVKLRYKAPDADVSVGRDFIVPHRIVPIESASGELQFAAAVAAFGMTLRDSSDRGAASLGLARQLAARGLAKDPNGARREFIELVQVASTLRDRRKQ